MARYEKGKPKTGGRKKGVQNKTTEQIREQIKNVVSNKLDVFEADLATMSPFQQWQILEKVTKYFLPALNKNDDSVEHSGNISINISFDDGGDLDDQH